MIWINFSMVPKRDGKAPNRNSTSTEATPELMKKLRPDAIIVASGHGDESNLPKKLKGLERDNVITTMDLLSVEYNQQIALLSVVVLWDVILLNT